MELDRCRIGTTIAAIDYHVTSSRCLVSVSARGVTLGYQLRQSQLPNVDGRRFRFEGDEQVVGTVRRRYTRLPEARQRQIDRVLGVDPEMLGNKQGSFVTGILSAASAEKLSFMPKHTVTA